MEKLNTPIGRAISILEKSYEQNNNEFEKRGIHQSILVLKLLVNLEREEFKRAYLEAYDSGSFGIANEWDELLNLEKEYYKKISCNSIEELTQENLKYKIEDIEMPLRLYNSLKHHNFNYLEDVIKLTEKEFSYYRNVGRKQIYDLKIILKKHNLEFKK